MRAVQKFEKVYRLWAIMKKHLVINLVANICKKCFGWRYWESIWEIYYELFWWKHANIKQTSNSSEKFEDQALYSFDFEILVASVLQNNFKMFKYFTW